MVLGWEMGGLAVQILGVVGGNRCLGHVGEGGGRYKSFAGLANNYAIFDEKFIG